MPFVPSHSPPINAVPLSAVAPSKKLAPDGVRAEPPWLRRVLLPHLGFRRHDLPVRFIDEKAVTATDLVPHQNRFRWRPQRHGGDRRVCARSSPAW